MVHSNTEYREIAGKAECLDVERYGSDMPKMAAEAALRKHTGWDERATTTTAHAGIWRNPPLQRCPQTPERWPAPVEHPSCPTLWRAAAGDRPAKRTAA